MCVILHVFSFSCSIGNHILFLYNPSLSTTPNEGREVLLPEIIRKTATERLPLGQVDEAGDLGRQSTSGAMDVSRNSMTIITIQYIVLYIYIHHHAMSYTHSVYNLESFFPGLVQQFLI